MRLLTQKIILLTKIFLYLFIDFFISIAFLLKKTKNTNKILLTRIDNLGDFIVSLEFINETIKELKKEEKNIKIVFLCNDFLKNFINSLNIFDEVISVNLDKIFLSNDNFKIKITLKNIIYRIKNIWKFKKIKFKKIIHLNNKYTSHFLIKNFYSDEKISFFYSKNILNLFLKKFYTQYFNIKETNEIKKLNIFYNKIFDKKIDFSIPTLELKNFNLNAFEFLKDKNYYCLGLGASEKIKIWDIENFANLAKKIIFNKKVFIVLIGSKNEIFFGEKFMEYMDKNEKKFVFNLIGKTSILDLLNIIKFSKIVIGNDSGYIHVASLVKVKSIAIVPGINFKSFLPYKIKNTFTPICLVGQCEKYKTCKITGCNKKLSKNKSYMCMKKILVEDVFDIIKNL